MKEGSFEWVNSYDDIKHLVRPFIEEIVETCSEPKVLIVGCGTSKLSEAIQQDFCLSEVVSIDNDAGCIEHMRSKYSHNSGLEWVVYDMIEDYGIIQHNIMDKNEYFDIIVDKGTLDAVLVEGSIATMLVQIHRLLNMNTGVYILISINTPALLGELFRIPELNLSVKAQELDAAAVGGDDRRTALYTMIICRKRSNEEIDIDVVAAKEQGIMDRYFKSDNPFLDASAEARIRRQFLACNDELGLVDLRTAHKIMFDQYDHLDYSYELFSEDILRFELSVSGSMNVDEAIHFIKMMQ